MTTKTDDQRPTPDQLRIAAEYLDGSGPCNSTYPTWNTRLEVAAWLRSVARGSRAAVEADRQGRMPSDEEILDVWGQANEDEALPPRSCLSLIRFTRALLSRYSSQPAISDFQLQCILQVYDDALDKAREGREFDNPGRPGSLEARAWDAGTRRGKDLRPIAVQPAASVCDSCGGSGEATRIVGGGPDAHDESCLCPTCGGTGDGRSAASAKPLPDLIVTKGGVPFEDQAEGVRQFKAAAAQPAASAGPSQITDAMVDAYLKAQADVVRKVDDMWGNGGKAAEYLHPVQESCRAGLQAALRVAAPVAQEPVGEAVAMPGTSGGFTMATFRGADVPVGTKLYAAPAQAQHPDDAAVDAFAAAMKAKLAQKRAEGRGGWEDKTQCSQDRLSLMLRGHVAKGDPVDVANFAMMLHQRGERISGRDAASPSAQAREDAVPNRDAVDLAREGMALYQTGMAEHIICKELVRIADAARAAKEKA